MELTREENRTKIDERQKHIDIIQKQIDALKAARFAHGDAVIYKGQKYMVWDVNTLFNGSDRYSPYYTITHYRKDGSKPTRVLNGDYAKEQDLIAAE